MNIEDIREYALSLSHVTEDMPFGPDALALRIGGKIFCLLELSGHWQFYNLKVDPISLLTCKTGIQAFVRVFT